jgi:hypothetical protein
LEKNIFKIEKMALMKEWKLKPTKADSNVGKMTWSEKTHSK